MKKNSDANSAWWNSNPIDVAQNPGKLTGIGENLLRTKDFFRKLENAIERADFDKSSISLIHFEIENISLIQDGFGSTIKNEIIRCIGDRLSKLVSLTGRITLKADGNIIIFISGNSKISRSFAKIALAAMAAPIEIKGYSHKIRCFAGIAVYPEHGASAQLLEYADLALRIAKQLQRNRICLYLPEMSLSARKNSLLVHDLAHAIDNDELLLLFQPKINIISMQVSSVEALVRWNHPRYGYISPAQFIAIAEKHHLITRLGDWVFEQACSHAAEWLKRGLRMRIAVNISRFQLQQDNLVDKIILMLDRYGLEPSHFTCEITETTAMFDSVASQKMLEKMRHAGLNISIDDFGVGHSSLATLRHIPATELKIDGDFLKDIETSPMARTLLSHIVSLCKELKLHLVAERVETIAQRDILVAMGINELQGHLFSLPIPDHELQRMAFQRKDSGQSKFRSSLFLSNFDALNSP